MKPDNSLPLMQMNIPGDNCPKCGAPEIPSNTPRTTYECGSSDYDGRPGTFNQSQQCKDKFNKLNP